MKYLRNGFYLGFILLMLLAACGPGTPTVTPTSAGLVNKKPLPAPNVLVTVVPPVLALVCTPPMPTDGEISSYCANQTKGLGGITYSDMTNLSADTTNSYLVGDPIPGSVSCNLDNDTSTATCSGPQNGAFQAMVCSTCGEYNGSSNASFVCANGYNNDGQGNCYAADPKKNLSSMWCLAGTHYDNTLQNCADNVTNKLASPCPPGSPAYTPFDHKCWNKVEMAFNCQTFTFQLGACVALNKVPNVVPFCQNNDANIGGANITFPAGSTLSVDIKSNRLDSCTPGATQPDGTQLFTCLGTAGGTFNAQLCTDPASCTTTKETLGTCAGRNNQGSGPGPAPCIPSRGVTCP